MKLAPALVTSKHEEKPFLKKIPAFAGMTIGRGTIGPLDSYLKFAQNR
jgi:hypothetical protein